MSLGATGSCSEAHLFLRPAAEAGERHAGEGWREITGEFCSIMLIGEAAGEGGEGRAGVGEPGSDCRVPFLLVFSFLYC